MRRWDATRKIFEPYSRLRKAAHEARYDGTLFRPADVAEYVRCHDTVRQEMLKALGVLPGLVD
jgi:hypothetical protein